MDLSGIQRTARRAATPNRVFTAQVVRSDVSGLWVVPIGEDADTPVGPCKGGWLASGSRVPPGALVALVMTPDGPWAIGVDNPQLASADELAPFPNPSFEQYQVGPYGYQQPTSWRTFWSSGGEVDATLGDPPLGKWTMASDPDVSIHGLRSMRVTANKTYPGVESGAFTVPAGATVEVTSYAAGTGVQPELRYRIWSNTAGQYPGPFGSGAVTVETTAFALTPDFVRYRSVFTIPPAHSSVNLFVEPGSNPDTGGLATVWVDNVNVQVVNLDPSASHQDFMRRAALVLLGGGSRVVTAGGNVSWSQPFTIAGAGYDATEAADGRFVIGMPPNGTVIPVHSSGTRVSHTVAGGVILLNADDALWYELPIAAAATSQPGRFHIIGSSAADGFTVPANWILVVRRASAWSATSFAQEYRWGDGRHQDPMRSPSLNAGWIAGTIAPTFTKTADDMVVMRGRVRNGTGSAFTLPEGYWPGVQHDAFVRDGAGAAALLTVTTAGVVTTAGNNTDHSIATMFPARP